MKPGSVVFLGRPRLPSDTQRSWTVWTNLHSVTADCMLTNQRQLHGQTWRGSDILREQVQILTSTQGPCGGTDIPCPTRCSMCVPTHIPALSHLSWCNTGIPGKCRWKHRPDSRRHSWNHEITGARVHAHTFLDKRNESYRGYIHKIKTKTNLTLKKLSFSFLFLAYITNNRHMLIPIYGAHWRGKSYGNRRYLLMGYFSKEWNYGSILNI